MTGRQILEEQFLLNLQHQFKLLDKCLESLYISGASNTDLVQLQVGSFKNKYSAKKRAADKQPLNYNHPNPFDELDKALGNNPDSTSGKDKKKNRFEHLEIETDGTDDSKGDSGAPAKQP